VVAATVPVALAALRSAGADKRQGGGGCSRRAPCEENGGMGKFFASGAFLMVERRVEQWVGGMEAATWWRRTWGPGAVLGWRC
jgi:hypothetical protein